MRAPKVENPKEDPADKAARQAEQARAETSRIQETQGILSSDTLRRLRKFGRATQQSVPIVTAAAQAGGSASSSGGSILSGGSGFSLGSIGGAGGGFGDVSAQLY